MTTVIDKGHSRYGGSVIGRVIACPGSPALCDTVPKRPEGPYAAEGNAAHYVAEQCLKTNVPAKKFLDFLYTKPGAKQIVVTGNMVDAVQQYLDEVNAEMALTPDAELYVEVGFDIESESAPGEVWGSADAVVYHPSTGRLRIFDYKHGVGISVSAEDNAQPKFYAMGAVFSHPDWKISQIVCTIVQPRARDVEEVGAVKDWEFDVVELLEFQDEVETAVSMAKKVAFEDSIGRVPLKAMLKTGPHCRWCDAAAVCPAKEAEALAAAHVDFATVTEITAADFPEPKTLDVERLSKVVAGIGLISAWQAQCQEFLEGLILGGHEVPGWKAVEKIGRAKWIEDPTEIVAYAGMAFDLTEDQIMPRKLTTIGEAEKLLKAAGAKKEDLDSFKLKFTIKESSGLTIAPSSDRRQAVNAIEADFGTVKI